MTSTRPPRQSDGDLARAALSGEYEIVEEIGRGGMAVVYRALEKGLEREVAIKILPPHFTFDDSFVQRFQREARIAAQLEHPNIVPIYRVGQSGDVIYLVMKLLRGQALSDRLRQQGVLSPAEVVRVLSEVASALAYAAKRGVVHRDVKPDNIMLDTDDRCIVTDFGIARSAAESQLTSTGMSVGTPRYMSPEQARAKPVDGRSDIYSLGVVGYECLTGLPPFEVSDPMGMLMAHINSPVPVPRLASEEARAVYAVIERMLAKDPGDRYQSADDVVAALGGAAGTGQFGIRKGMSTLVGATTRARALSPTRPVRGVTDPTIPLAVMSEAKRTLGAVGRRVGALARSLQPRMRGVLDSTRPRVAAALESAPWLRSRRAWAGACVGVGLLTAAYYAVHFATMHRSRCLPISATALAPSIGKAVPFTILVDAPGARDEGDALDVYYDVCGLAPGTAYTTKVSVTRNGFLNRLAGRSTEPIRTAYNESASSSAVRRHRTIATGDLPPGQYTLTVAVTDAAERIRERKTTFDIVGR
jgi:predicted Ser/Thr protein kinase